MAGLLKQFFKPRKPEAAPTAPQPAARSQPERAPAPPRTYESDEDQAIHGASARLRLEAVERIQDPDSLQRISKALKGRDKGGFQAARRKLKEHREAEAAEADRLATIDSLIEQLEQHRDTRDDSLYRARLDALESRWEALEGPISDAQQKRYHEVLSACRVRASEITRQEEARQAELQRREEQQNTLDLLSSTITDLTDNAPEQDPSLSSLDALRKTQRNRWEEACHETPPQPQDQNRFDRLMTELDNYMEAVRRYDSDRERLQAALADEDRETLRTLLGTIAWPREFPSPALIREARQVTGQKAAHSAAPSPKTDPKALRQELDQAIQKLEASLEDQNLHHANRDFRAVQKLRDQLPRKAAADVQDRIRLLGFRVGELRDWQGFATRPKQENLCEQMEYLASQHMEPEAKAAHIRDLQQQWRDLGGSSDQALWTRFKSAADEAWKPCHEYFDAKSDLKNINLKKRENICDQLQEFVDHIDWEHCDWKGVENIHRHARQEWREAKPIHFRANRPVQKRFDRLLKSINAHLDEERDRNIERKRDIVQRAEALIDHEPLKEATEQAKALQKEWEGVGITPHRKDRDLWKAFRAACDRIFGRISEQREAQQEAQGEALQLAEHLIEAAEQLTSEEATQARLDELNASFRQLDLPNRDRRPLQERFHNALDTAAATRLAQLKSERVNAWLSALTQQAKGEAIAVDSFTHEPGDPQQLTGETEPTEQARSLCVRAEVLAGAPSPEEDQSRRMALQVNRLNQGFQGQDSPESEWDELDTLVATFCQLPAEVTEPLHGRLGDALKQWAAAEP